MDLPDVWLLEWGAGALGSYQKRKVFSTERFARGCLEHLLNCCKDVGSHLAYRLTYGKVDAEQFKFIESDREKSGEKKLGG